MKIAVLPQMYNCGCGRGMNGLESHNILEKINRVIEWDKCTWPKKEDDTEDKEFLGNPPQFKPGNCLLWDGSVIAVDSPDRLALVVSETGPLSICRFETAVCTEIEFLDCPKIECERVTKEKPEKDLETYRIGFSKWSIIKEHTGDLENEEPLKVMDKELLFLPVTVWIKKNDIVFDPEEIDKETIEMLANSIYSWLAANKKEKGN